MTNDKYILRYLPLFYKDLEEKNSVYCRNITKQQGRTGTIGCG